MMRKRLIDVEPAFATQGIFSALALKEIPWETDASILNRVYYANHSGQKSVSPMVNTMSLLHTDGKLTAEDEAELADIAYSMFGDYWSKEYATLSLEYDPIANYNMEETETPAETTRTTTPAETTDTITPPETTQTITPAETTVTETPAETTQTVTPAETTVTETPAETTATGSNEGGIYGFDSSEAVGSDTLSAETKYTTDAAGTTKTETDTAGTTKTETDTAGTTKTETDTAGTTKTETDAAGSTVRTVQSAETEEITVQNARTLQRVGNIGVTTSQQMLQSERELWTWNFFYDIVFKDIDTLLTLQIYR